MDMSYTKKGHKINAEDERVHETLLEIAKRFAKERNNQKS
jgi:hypothetical protein